MPNNSGNAVPSFTHGTLVVAIATPRYIVVATDSRRTDLVTGQHWEDSKKLLRVGKKRVLAIAGLAEATLPYAPGLSEQVAPLLDQQIAKFFEYGAAIDDREWNDPPAPEYRLIDKQLEEVLRRHQNDIPYIWWKMINGPTQTIFNIYETFVPNQDLAQYRLDGLLAGFKDNGDAKIERFTIVPHRQLSDRGRVMIGISEKREKASTEHALLTKTMGISWLANQVFEGDINPAMLALAEHYPAIKSFLKRRQQGTQDALTEEEAVALSKDLIRSTAEREQGVGSDPIQLAILRPNSDSEVKQPEFPKPSVFLPPDGTWMLGWVFTADDPFGEWRGAVYTSCLIENNRIPIPLGNNVFYGNTFRNATFVYDGGRVIFGSNNVVEHVKLLIPRGTDESALASIMKVFEKIERTL